MDVRGYLVSFLIPKKVQIILNPGIVLQFVNMFIKI